MVRSRILLIVFPLLLQGFVVGEEKRVWNSDTNFDNPSNWDDGRLPCSKDTVIFDPDTSVAVVMPVGGYSSLFQQMVLPTHGELVFVDGPRARVNDDDSCRGKEVHFKVNKGSWFNPDKWNVSSAYSVPPDETFIRNRAVPHAFRVPCKTDAAIFPKDKSFAVSVDSDVPVTIGTIEINGMRYEQNMFQAFLASREGFLLFQGAPRITISGTGCNNATGCPCGNDNPKVMREVCRLVQCPDVECYNPIKPDGHCCLTCGAYFKFRYEADFEINRLGNVIQSHLLQNSQRGDVHTFTVKTSDGYIQTVFVDPAQHTGYAKQVAKDLYQLLEKDLGTSNPNRLKSVKMFASGDWFGGPSLRRRGGLSGLGKALLVILFTLLACAFLAWYIRRRRRIPGFSFARFDLHSSKIELELGTTPHEDLSPEEESRLKPTTAEPSKGFDNPIYGTEGVTSSTTSESIKRSIQEIGESAAEAIVEDETVVENPMYMIFESSEQGEKESDST